MFNKGDVVKLNSGGPKMTVTEVIEDSSSYGVASGEYRVGDVLTQWFNDSTLDSGSFPQTSVHIVTAKSKRRTTVIGL